MDRPVLNKDQVKPLLETRFIKVADLQYNEMGHYYSVSRRPCGQVPLMSDDEFRGMVSDAVTCIVIVKTSTDEPRLLLTKECRYPVGQFLRSPPAGLIDAADRATENAVLSAAKREIEEETGLSVKDTDRIFVVNPLCFSSPGLTDESNALACAVVDIEEDFTFSAENAESTERIGDYTLYSREDAARVLRQGLDDDGIFYSVYTFLALMYFVSGLWEEA